MQFVTISALHSLTDSSSTKKRALKNSKRNLASVIAKKLLLPACKKHLDFVIVSVVNSKELHMTGIKLLTELCIVSRDMAVRVGRQPSVWSQLVSRLKECHPKSGEINVEVADCILELILCVLSQQSEIPGE